MNDNLEVLLFDMGTLYVDVHHGAREVCAQRGITLRELDLCGDQQDLAVQHQVGHFPQCFLFRGDRIIGETHVAYHSPESFAVWLDSAMATESRPASGTSS